MLIQHSQYIDMVQQIRLLRAQNSSLIYQKQQLLERYLSQQSHREQISRQYCQLQSRITRSQQQLSQEYNQQTSNIISQLQMKQRQQEKLIKHKFQILQNDSYQKLKKLEIQFKDFRLKSYLNDLFFTKLVTLYLSHVEGDQNGVTHQEIVHWVKELGNTNKNNRGGKENSNISKCELNHKKQTKLFNSSKSYINKLK